MMLNAKENKPGFAVITLLLIGLIIFIASALGLLYLSNKYSQERDQTRIDDMEVFAYALEAYYQKYGTYPVGEAKSTDSAWGINTYQEIGNPLGILITEGFVESLPSDPINRETGCICGSGHLYYYCYFPPGSSQVCVRDAGQDETYTSEWYHLSVCLETSEAECQKECGGAISPQGNYCATDTVR